MINPVDIVPLKTIYKCGYHFEIFINDLCNAERLHGKEAFLKAEVKYNVQKKVINVGFFIQ